MLAKLLDEPFDAGSEHFEPTHIEVTSVDVGNPVFNVIPAEASARFNVRFNDRQSPQSLRALIEARCTAAAPGVRFRADFEPASDCFLTSPGPFVDLVSRAIEAVTRREAARSTTGGTSDARFVKDYCPVVELGLVGRTMHQIDEHAPLADLKRLTAVYRRILEKYFESSPA
jgi:succinyl-diaminopimelate desuccinylase